MSENFQNSEGMSRCDADGSATGLVELSKDDLLLLFCSHHFSRYELVLLSSGWEVSSDRRSSLVK